MSDAFHYIDVHQVDDVTTIRLHTESGLAETFDKVAQELYDLVGRQASIKLVVNLMDVEYLHSTALGKFVSLERRINTAGGKLCLCNLREAVYELFEITGLDQVLTIVPDEATALSKLT